MSDDMRPEWNHAITENEARWLAKGMVTRIEHHWEMTGVDTSRAWITLRREKDERKFAANFLNSQGYFQFNPNWRELVTPTYKGEQAIKTLEEIDAWEKKNKRERAEFERLKAKFGSAPNTTDTEE